MGRGLLLASQLRLGLEDVLPDKLRAHSPYEREQMPDFIAEWFAAEKLCLVRFTCDGYFHFQPNARATDFFVQTGSKAKDAPAQPAADAARAARDLAFSVRLVMVRTFFPRAQNRAVLAGLIADLHAQVVASRAAGLPSAALCHASAASDRPVVLRDANGTEHLATLRARMAARDESKQVWNAVEFTLCGAAAGAAAEWAAGASSEPSTSATDSDTVRSPLPAPHGGPQQPRPLPQQAAAAEPQQPQQLPQLIGEADLEALLGAGVLDEAGIDSLLEMAVDLLGADAAHANVIGSGTDEYTAAAVA